MLLCIATSAFCYAKIYINLRHHQAQVQDHVHQGQPNGGENPLNIAKYRKTVSSALWVQITLMACYLPYAIVAITATTRIRTEFIDLAWNSRSDLLMVCLVELLNLITILRF